MLKYVNVGIMSVVDYNGEKLKEGKLVVKNWVCSSNGGRENLSGSVLHRQFVVVRFAGDWLICRELPQSRSGPLQG